MTTTSSGIQRASKRKDVWVFQAKDVTEQGRSSLCDPERLRWHLPNGFPVRPADAGIQILWDNANDVLTIVREDPIDEMWRVLLHTEPDAYRLGHRGPVPATGPGILYVKKRATSEIAAVVCSGLREALADLDWTPEEARQDAIFVPGDIEELRERSAILSKPAQSIGQGRPRLFKDVRALRSRCPKTAGIYRINRVAADGEKEVYVGQAWDLHRRLLAHEKVREWGWQGPTGITHIDVMVIVGIPYTLADLDQAEEWHIAKARARFEAGQGPRVANRTIGRNGRKAKPRTQVKVWTYARYRGLEDSDFRIVDTVNESQVDGKFTLVDHQGPAATLNTLKVGTTVEAEVTGIAKFGAYLDVGGVPGLLHISEMARRPITSPDAVVHVGEHVHVQLIDVNYFQGRFEASLKRTEETPWDTYIGRHDVGEHVVGEVAKVVPYGAFVHLADGVDGLIHISKMANRFVKDPNDVVRPGQRVEVEVLDIDTSRHRIGLRLVAPTT